MKGSFNASVQSQIDGLSTAPLGGGATSSASSGATSAAAGSKTTSGTAASKTGSSTSTSTAKATGAASGAERVVFSGLAGAVALFAAVFALAL